MNLIRDIDRAVEKLRDRLDTIDEEIGALLVDIPGDAGVCLWPRDLQDALDELHDERVGVLRELALLLRVKRQVA